jgi:hypothetical protein
MMTLRARNCLVTLVDHDPVSAAAAALRMSQPAISHQIASLGKGFRYRGGSHASGLRGTGTPVCGYGWWPLGVRLDAEHAAMPGQDRHRVRRRSSEYKAMHGRSGESADIRNELGDHRYHGDSASRVIVEVRA